MRNGRPPEEIRCVDRYSVTCCTAVWSAPSIAITTPRELCSGEVGSGAVMGGEIFASTFILLRAGIDMTIAFTLFAAVSD